MGVYESNSKIKKANEDMGIMWQKTISHWKDVNAEKFEREFVERLAVEVKRSENALENIGIILNQVRFDLKETDQ